MGDKKFKKKVPSLPEIGIFTRIVISVSVFGFGRNRNFFFGIGFGRNEKWLFRLVSVSAEIKKSLSVVH